MLYLTELLSNYKGSVLIEGNGEHLPITLVTADSRHAVPGSLFVAIPGAKADGAASSFEAIDKGATAVITSTESTIHLPKSIVLVKVDNVRLALAKIAEKFYAP